VLTMGRPVSAARTVPSIVDENGSFFKYTSILERLPHLNMDEVKAEWRAQIGDSSRQRDGIPPISIRTTTPPTSHPVSSAHHAGTGQEYDCAIRYPFTKSRGNGGNLQTRPGSDAGIQPAPTGYLHVNFYDERRDEGRIAEHHQQSCRRAQRNHVPSRLCGRSFAKESVYNFQRERELKDPDRSLCQRSHSIKRNRTDHICRSLPLTLFANYQPPNTSRCFLYFKLLQEQPTHVSN
jgi:predicted glycoside hydrolase/deacetylase ChbG (UPF0249 family)